MWIAKSKYDGKTYGQEFVSIYDCQNYINKELKEESDNQRRLRAIKLFETKYNRKPIKNSVDDITVSIIGLNLCNGILCYNVEQERFCEGFDF